MKELASIFILALLMMAAGCQYDPHAHLYTTEQPQKTNVVGRYVLISQSLSQGGLTVLSGRVCSVELKADGTFIASNVPPSKQDMNPGTNFFQSLVSAQGTWSVTTVGGVGIGGGKSKPRWGVELETSGAMLLSPGLMGTKPPYGLIYTLGDPDSGTALILERAK